MMTSEVNIFERLKSKSDIKNVYKMGSVIISKDRKLKANLLSSESRTNKVRIAISVSSKAGRSVWRNRLKRIIREIIREEKEFLKEPINNNNQGLSIIFSPYRINQASDHQLLLKDLRPAIKDILNKIKKNFIGN